MSKQVIDYYDEFSTMQVKTGINLRHLSILTWAKKFGLKKNHSILEIGCGIGTETRLLAETITNGKITAIDISPKSIEIAKSRLPGVNNVSFRAADVITHDFAEKFDFIVLPDVIEHIPLEQHPALFIKLRELIKDNGTILVHIPAPNSLEWSRQHEPNSLQIIDQPIYTDVFAKNVYPSGLYIYHLETYSIWKVDDYQVIILKPRLDTIDYSKPFQATLFKKIKNRITLLLKSN